MSEMVERVALAIQAKCVERGYRGCPEPLIHHVAAAAIAAMREPTPKMWDAMARVYQSPACMWMIGIDAALEPATSPASPAASQN